MPVEEQVVSIFAGVRGYLDARQGRGRDALRGGAAVGDPRQGQADILKAIRDENARSSTTTEAKLKAVLDQFAKTFA